MERVEELLWAHNRFLKIIGKELRLQASESPGRDPLASHINCPFSRPATASKAGTHARAPSCAFSPGFVSSSRSEIGVSIRRSCLPRR